MIGRWSYRFVSIKISFMNLFLFRINIKKEIKRSIITWIKKKYLIDKGREIKTSKFISSDKTETLTLILTLTFERKSLSSVLTAGSRPLHFVLYTT